MRNHACFQLLTRKPATEHFNRALEEVTAGDVCIDCGANVGVVSRAFASRGARTYCFEPDPWCFEQLKENLNDQDGIALINSAVGVGSGKIEFFRDKVFLSDPDTHSLASSILPRSDREQISVEVEIVDLIQFMKDLGTRIKILKMDIEGAEVPILERLLEDDFIRNIDHVFVETHDLQFTDLLERTVVLRETVRARGLTHVNLDWH